jgi:DNA-binding transcriptional MerR regulator/methylmalonyl-CoA mutase cobalamin-binding subunit
MDGANEVNGSTELYSIGDVAEASGVSPDTLRMWERRYGRPVPVRLPSGHRRYTGDQLTWLRRVAEALAHGHRPRTVVCANDDELEALLADAHREEIVAPEIQALMGLVLDFRGEDLTQSLLDSWHRLGPDQFLTSRVSPLMKAIGRAWADGELDIRHEHFTSEIVADLLRTLRSGLVREADGPVLVLATLRDELHGIGLQMCALVCALDRVRARVLGVGTPNEEIAAAARELGADAVAISVSLATGGVETDRRLAELRKLLPDEVRLVVGGAGARGVRRGPRGIEYATSLEGFRQWIGGLAGDGADGSA